MNTEIMETAYLSWLARSMLPSEQLRNLMQYYHSGEAVYQAVARSDSAVLDILSSTMRQKLFRTNNAEQIKNLVGLIQKHGIKGITITDISFPSVLEDIRDPVSILFYQGHPECLKGRKLAVVGSRSASYNGLKATEKIARDLSLRGIKIVSGFAYGIDTASHHGCLQGGSPTIAVMGCGLDQNYPAENYSLRSRIVDSGGILISEFAPGEKPLAAHFPYRNRIISALGDALILMEAKIRSGSMTSVSHALDQGKDVFVYPGDPSSPHYEGNHQLLREGGIYFTSALDILEDMKWLDNPGNQVQNIDCAASAEKNSPVENTVYTALKKGPLSFDQLTAWTGISPAELMSTLTIMQIRGDIESLPGKIFQIRH